MVEVAGEGTAIGGIYVSILVDGSSLMTMMTAMSSLRAVVYGNQNSMAG